MKFCLSWLRVSHRIFSQPFDSGNRPQVVEAQTSVSVLSMPVKLAERSFEPFPVKIQLVIETFWMMKTFKDQKVGTAGEIVCVCN